MTWDRVLAALWATATLLAAGCSATPPSRFYQLSATPTSPAPASTVSVSVGPVAVPAAVDRPQVVLTTGPNQVRLDEFNRWAGPVQNEIARVVAENLVAMLGTSQVMVSAQTLAVIPDYRAAIDVQRFESAPGQAASLDAVWTVARVKDGRVRAGRTTVREQVPDGSYDALVAAHSRAVAQLSRDIATAVQGLERGAP